MAGVSADIERVEDFFICFDAAVFGADRRMIGAYGERRAGKALCLKIGKP